MTNDSQLSPNCGPIAYPESLADHLGIPLDQLREVAENLEKHWRPGRKLVKKDGTVRKTHSASAELKKIHSRIKDRILRRTEYPDYLYGSLPKTIEGKVRDHIANARLHSGQRLIISADIKGYFPSVGESVVHSIWQGFYPFAPDVAALLTRLTTYEGEMPQGWSCSSYLAQLVFWDSEHHVAQFLREKGITYSRLTDDVTLSTNTTLSDTEITNVISTITKMLNDKGTRINRTKTRVDSKARRQSVNKINISIRGMTLSKEYRKEVRAKVHRVVTNPDDYGDDLDRELQSANGKVSYLMKFHPREAKNLKSRLGTFEQSRK